MKLFPNAKKTVLLAVAGSGKTHWLVDHIAESLKTRRPEEIGFVTFTRAGVHEGLSRICALKHLDPDDLPYFCTLHSMCFTALGLKWNRIFNASDERRFNSIYGYTLNRALVNLSSRVAPTEDTKYLDMYDIVRSGGQPEDKIFEFDLSYYNRITAAYNEFKAKYGLVDFYDCLIRYALDGKPLPCRVVYIDECQDLTELQWLVMTKAFANAEEVYVAGDDCQTIYTYNGARPDIFIDLARSEETSKVSLSMSHRIPNAVYDIAHNLTQSMQTKIDKAFDANPDVSTGTVEEYAGFSDMLPLLETAHLSDSTKTEWYILVRNRVFSDSVIYEMQLKLIPYWTDDGFFMDNKTISLLKEYSNFRLKGYKTQRAKEKFMKDYNITDFSQPFIETNLFPEDVKYLYQSYIDRYGFRTLEAMSKWNPQILISTVHHVKGGEARNVAYILDCTHRTALNAYRDLDSELRIMYVAVTRASERLCIVHSTSGESLLDDIFTEAKNQ